MSKTDVNSIEAVICLRGVWKNIRIFYDREKREAISRKSSNEWNFET